MQALAGAIRSTVQRNTGFTPNLLMLGREVSTPIDIMLGTMQCINADFTSEYVRKLADAMSESHKLARETLRAAQLRQKKDYDTKLVENSYEIGDSVYLVDSAKKVGEVSKLKSPWKGPYVVSEVISPILYRVKNRKKTFVVNHDRMKLCCDKDTPIWLTRIRNRILNLDSTFIIDDNDETLDSPVNGQTQDESLDTNKPNDDTAFDFVQDIGKLFKENCATKVPQRPVVSNLPTTRIGRKTKVPMHLQGYVAKNMTNYILTY